MLSVVATTNQDLLRERKADIPELVEYFVQWFAAQRGADATLGLKRTTLFYKMKRLGITPPADNSQD